MDAITLDGKATGKDADGLHPTNLGRLNPAGVGPPTRAFLLTNVVELAEDR